MLFLQLKKNNLYNNTDTQPDSSNFRLAEGLAQIHKKTVFHLKQSINALKLEQIEAETIWFFRKSASINT